MARIQPIGTVQATGKAKQLLDAVKAELGMTNFPETLGHGSLDAKFREQFALALGRRTPASIAFPHTLGVATVGIVPFYEFLSRSVSRSVSERRA